MQPLSGRQFPEIFPALHRTTITGLPALFVEKSTNYRNVSLKIPNGHLPPTLKENDEVDIWFSDSLTNTSTLLIPNISVIWVDELNTNFGGVSTVVVAVPKDLVANLIKTSRTEGMDLVQIEN